MTIAIVTDSNAQLPAALAERYGIEVVALTVTVDGQQFSEGVDLDADDFYARFDHETPTVSTSQPSPGAFAAAYATVAERGASEILSIHIGSSVSGTLNSARIAVGGSRVPVRLVDTGTASFGVSCCVWEAASAVERGASAEEAAVIAENLAGSIGNVFVVRALDLARRGGRLHADVGEGESVDAIPVLSLIDGQVRAVGEARELHEAATVMADFVTLSGESLKVAVGVADRGAMPLWTALEAQLVHAPQVREVIRYRIGPSVGAHTGPGTAGAFFYPAPS